jgi:hypothetical protein
MDESSGKSPRQKRYRVVMPPAALARTPQSARALKRKARNLVPLFWILVLTSLALLVYLYLFAN